jgi:CSLREA domain-containing protein
MNAGRVAASLVAILGWGGVARAATITVTSLADNSTVDGQVTLREAILAANTDTSVDGSMAGSGPDQIVFAVGPGAIALNGTALPTITQALALTGPGAGRLAIDGGQASRLLEVSNGAVLTVSRLTLRNGRVQGGNGGAVLSAGSLNLDGCVLSGNAVTGDGGAVWSGGNAALSINDTTFSGNSAQNGGAVHSSAPLQLFGSTFYANSTGGIAPFAGGGGAIENTGLATINNSTFASNFAGNGGAIVNNLGLLTIRNSTITGNTAINSGGGIADSLRSVELHATIVADNFRSGGATRQDVAAAVTGNSSANVIGVDTGLTGITHGSNGNQIGTAVAPLDPVLGPLQNNGGLTATRSVLPGSPALDGGSAATCMVTDQRGIVRPLDGDGDATAVCDVGAYEAFRVAPTGLRFFALAPCRVADTRGPAGPAGGPALDANATRFFRVGGQCGIPASAKGVALNITAVVPSEAGNLRLYPAGSASPLASALNFAAGRTRANSALLPLGAAGQIAVQCDMPPGATGTAHLVLDITGYLE